MKKLPGGHSKANITEIRSVADIGKAVKQARTQQKLKQLDLAGLANTGNRFIIELEKGKPTIQLQKALEVLALLGLDVLLRKRGGR
jgi:y4mF family transcriptional regulator